MAQTYEKLYIESILVNFAMYRDSQPNLTEILGKLEKKSPPNAVGDQPFHNNGIFFNK